MLFAVLNGFIGNTDLERYVEPDGSIVIGFYSFLGKFFFVTFLSTMFVRMFNHIDTDYESIRRMEMVRLKNSKSFDNVVSGITLTFFPINAPLLPFLIPVMIF